MELDTAWDWKLQDFLFCLLLWSLVFTPTRLWGFFSPHTEMCFRLSNGHSARRLETLQCLSGRAVLFSDFQCSPCSLDSQGQSAARMKQLPILSQQESGSEPWPAQSGWEAWETQQSERKSALSRAVFLGLQFLMHLAHFFWVISTPGATFGRVEREVFYLQQNNSYNKLRGTLPVTDKVNRAPQVSSCHLLLNPLAVSLMAEEWSGFSSSLLLV